MQQQAAVMDDELSRQWNEWLMKAIDKVVVVIGEETGKMLDVEVRKLQAEIGVLRSDIEVMRSVMGGKTVEMKRDRDAA